MHWHGLGVTAACWLVHAVCIRERVDSGAVSHHCSATHRVVTLAPLGPRALQASGHQSKRGGGFERNAHAFAWGWCDCCGNPTGQ